MASTATAACSVLPGRAATPRLGRAATGIRTHAGSFALAFVSHRAAPSTRTSTRATLTPAALVIGHDEEALCHTAAAVRRSTGGTLTVVSLLHSVNADGLTGAPTGVSLPLTEGPWDLCWRLEGSAEDAAVVGTDPTDGLLRCIGMSCVLCVVGVSREVCLGEDANGARLTRAARRAAVAGVPTVGVSVPTTSADAPTAPACEALEALVKAMRRGGALGAFDAGPENSPRAHFPFPTEARWASLGTAQLPVDDHLAGSLFAAAAAAEDVAAADCWSLGGLGTASHRAAPSGGGGGGGRAAGPDPAALRRTLRGAFREADVFVTLHVPPTWHPSRGFASARPGVLWRQQRVRAGVVDAHAGDTYAAGKDEDVIDPNPRGGEGGGRDLWGRTLPSQSLNDVRADERGARFVPQLATERLVDGRAATASDASSLRSTSVDRSQCPRPPRAFVVSGGTVVADDCVGGDVDAVMRGMAAVVTVGTWPPGHPFSLVDDAAVEALRPAEGSGLPAWLCGE